MHPLSVFLPPASHRKEELMAPKEPALKTDWGKGGGAISHDITSWGTLGQQSSLWLTQSPLSEGGLKEEGSPSWDGAGACKHYHPMCDMPHVQIKTTKMFFSFLISSLNLGSRGMCIVV